MAQRPRKLAVKYSRVAFDALQEIWVWNADRYGVKHADEYIGFLESEANNLSSNWSQGRKVPQRPDLQFVVMRKRPRKYGHVAVFRVRNDTIEIIHFFHTAQNWEDKLDS